jgi:ABC-2 type transport system ATP-binding protein
VGKPSRGVMESEAVEPAVVIRSLEVVRGRTRALDTVSLDVMPGAVTGLLGPSGSGKTTLMRAIVGVQRVAAGEVAVLGLPAGSRDLRSQIGYMTQAPSVYADLTVRENLRYFSAVLGASAASVDRVIAVVDLSAHAAQVVSTLSGGERARVSLATALLSDPHVLVLDEPTVGLDPVLRHALWQTFHALADGGTTVLVSTHVMDEAERCDRLVLLHEGRVLATGSADELKARTGASDLDGAFLSLIGQGAAS